MIVQDYHASTRTRTHETKLIFKDQRLIGVADRLPRSKNIKFQESNKKIFKIKIGNSILNFLKSTFDIDFDFKNQSDF